MTFRGPDFTGSSALKNIAFDFEIFPDNSCTSLTGNNCGGNGNPNTPDLKVSAGSTLIDTYLAGTPTSPGYVHSPNSGVTLDETAPQEIGSASLSIPGGTTELTFADWPAAIGIVIWCSPQEFPSLERCRCSARFCYSARWHSVFDPSTTCGLPPE